MKKRFGTVSYNIYCNFTNYGSALQTWALHQAIKKVGDNYEPVLVDYCPDVLLDKDPLNPFKNMWDKDEESRKMCELSMPAIKENFYKFDSFYKNRLNKTKNKYTSTNFNDIVRNENIDGFVCGSDTIFCIDEFGGFDDGYYANYECMRNGYAVSYAASFGDPHFNADTYKILDERLKNFKYLGLRESLMLDYVKEHTSVPVKQVLDPTLLLTPSEYEPMISLENKALERENDKYLLLYARRYNPEMEKYAEELAQKNGWKIVEISLRATNASRHKMLYEAGVEEFLSLIKNAEFVVTNSFHGAIFSIQFKRPFYIFSREQCDNKIKELLQPLGLLSRLIVDSSEAEKEKIDYQKVHSILEIKRKESLEFLKQELENCK